MNIQLSDHFSYSKLFKFVLPSICMMVFTSIYSVVDGFFVSITLWKLVGNPEPFFSVSVNAPEPVMMNVFDVLA